MESIGSIITGLIAVVFTFGFMIFVHELGHFVAAKRAGMTVHEFALGFGPKLLSFGGNKKKKGEEESEISEPQKEGEEAKTVEPVKTEYCLRLVPLGGFVQLEGEDDPGNPDDPGNFNNKSPFARLKTILAGCAMNYIAGILLLIMVGLIWGTAYSELPAVVNKLKPGYPLEKAGIKQGDKIVEVNGQKIESFDQLSRTISPMKNNEEVTLKIERDKQFYDYKVNVLYDKEYNRGMLGFEPALGFNGFKFKKAPAEMVIKDAFSRAGTLTIMPAIIVQKMIQKQITPKEITSGTAGPIGISHMIFDMSKQGLPSLLFFAAILSILIGAFNLLPIPALDGMRAVFIVVEMIRKKPIDPEKEGRVHQIGFIVLILLVLVVTYNDIARIIAGKSLLK